MTDDNGEVLIEDGPDNKRLRIALRKFKGTPLLDVRYWYLDKKAQEFKPTGKGISLTRANYLGLRSIAVDHHDAVMGYLDIGSLAATHQGDNALVSQEISQNHKLVNTFEFEMCC